MSHIPALHRRTGYNVIPLPPRGAARRPAVASNSSTALDRARQAYLQELHALALATPDAADVEAEGTHKAVSQLLQLAADARRSASV